MHPLFLSEIRPEDRPLVGEKAWNVSRLAGLGFEVPDGFVLPATLRHVRGSSDLEGIVDRGLARLGASRVAVRSSGTAEDLGGASFAGMYETVLDIEGRGAVLDAVRHCWAALESDRLVSYAGRLGLDPSRLELALLVQRMVPAEAAGVLLTVDPISGDEARMLVEAAPGLGDAVVSGTVTPDRYVLDRDGAVVSSEPAGGAPVLSAGALASLVEVGRRIHRSFGRPQDIEFAFAGGRLHVLQSRPITALTFAERLGEWTTADFRDGGVSARVCTPFMWSLYRYVWGHAMPGYFRDLGLLAPGEAELEWGRMFFGRPYWNVGAVKNCVARLPGFVERNFDEDLAIEVLYEGPGRTTPTTAARIASALLVLLRLKRLYREQLELDRRIVGEFDGLEAGYRARDPDTLPWGEQVARWRRLVREDFFRVETSYFRTIYNLSNAKLDSKTVLDRLARRGVEVNYSTLVAALDDLRTLEPTRDLYRLAGIVHADPALRARFEAATADELAGDLAAGRGTAGSIWAEIAGFVDRHRYHSRTELDVTVPRWDEDPAFVLESLRSAIRGYDPERSPSRLAHAQRERYATELGRVESALGWFARRSFARKLANVRGYTWWREEMRDRSTRTYYLIRRETLALARAMKVRGLLAEVDHVWFLPWEDVLALAEGGLAAPEARRRIDEAREYYESYAAYEAPGEIGSRFRSGGAPLAAGDEWKGTAASPGRARGPARILTTIDHAARLAPGEILVAPFTDPGWTPLLGVAAAVGTETGGLLSHAAVISREYGIPAVLAVKGATRLLADGDDVEVDGTAGLVRRVRPT